MTRALALHATKNTGGKVDATGAFAPESVAFQKLHACHREGFDNALLDVSAKGDAQHATRRAAVETTIRRYRDLECVAIFCHGLRRSLQTGHTVATVGGLADAIAEATGPRVVVALYACSTGAAELIGYRGDSIKENGFAAALCRALYERDKLGHVDAHTNAAHTTKNPYVRRFAFGAPEGEFLIAPGDPRWKAWRAYLQTDGRLRFPLLTRDEIAAML